MNTGRRSEFLEIIYLSELRANFSFNEKCQGIVFTLGNVVFQGNCYLWGLSRCNQDTVATPLSSRGKISAHQRYALKCQFSPDSTLVCIISSSSDQFFVVSTQLRIVYCSPVYTWILQKLYSANKRGNSKEGYLVTHWILWYATNVSGNVTKMR